MINLKAIARHNQNRTNTQGFVVHTAFVCESETFEK